MKPAAFPGDLPIDATVKKSHKISDDEYTRLEKALGREPSYTELGVFSVMWSEHCSYKSSRVHLKRLPTKGPRVIQGPGENAGVVDIGDGFAAVFKMESHNHPSFIAPYQGAATGVGGILRDVFTMGARPIASLNSLRFGSISHPRTKELVHGVVAGIGGYGNSIGVPTVGGEVDFDSRYDGNILVNAFTCGIARTDRIFYGRAAGIGNPILYIGAKTGRDGIHGATMASDEFAEGGDAGQKMTMQVGDPFMGKLLIECCLELFQSDVLEGIQDMGAAGLTSSSVEMAGRAENGIEIDLDMVPRRAKKMSPYEILLSESQERMLLVAKAGLEQEVIAICQKWDLDAAVIGHVTDTKRWVVKATPGYDPLENPPEMRASVVVCDLPIGALTDDAPVYDRPRGKLPKIEEVNLDQLEGDDDWAADLLALVGSANLGSRRWIWQQYDHIVRGGTVVKPGSDAAVVRVPCEKDGIKIEKYLAFAVDCNGKKCELDPFVGGAMAVAEACRNVVCSGAEPIGLTDCLNFGNPERPEIMEQISRAIDGIAAACTALSAPIVSGNVSLYNETTFSDGPRAILPTPTIACVGLMQSPDDRLTQWFKRKGDVVVLLGPLDVDPGSLGGSAFAAHKTKKTAAAVAGKPITIDLEAEARLQKLVLELARSRSLQSAHDLSDGGLAIALAECGVTAPDFGNEDVGCAIDLPEVSATILFGEAPSRVVVSVSPDKVADVVARAYKSGVSATEIGKTGGKVLVVRKAGKIVMEAPLSAIRHARETCLEMIAAE
ncbi:MAG TPA: phosphoribosylformylglycinamidine synthase subunit PurL [Polyangiaceae bacterium]